MTLLLNPRVWVALALAALLAFSNLTAYRKGKANVRQAWDAAVATANAEARRLEQARQRRADEAAQMAAQREGRIRADADRARLESDGLRGDLSATREWAAKSRSAADAAVAVTTDLLGRCTAEYRAMAESAARADSEARELRQAWPQ